MTSWNEVFANPDRDETIVAHTERFDGLLDVVGALRNEGGHGTKEMRLMALLPGIVIEQYCYINQVQWSEFFADSKHIKRLCNDPDMAYFRVAPGRV